MFGSLKLFCYLCTVNKTKEISQTMKQNELTRRLKEVGCTFYRHGSRHDIWLKPDGKQIQVPRHGSKEVSPKLLNSFKDLLGL